MNKLGNPIAVGRTAEVYPYEDGKILKLFYPTTPKSWIKKEIEIGQYIQNMRLPVPKVYERKSIDERDGIVYERLEGPSLLNELATKPWNVDRYARLLAKLHIRVHEVQAPETLETQREWVKGGIPDSDLIPGELKTRILRLLDSLPDGKQLCHGDFHPGNILVTKRGPVIIDWMTVSKGLACGDVARTSIILEVAKAPEGTPMLWLLEWIRKRFLSTYLKTYLKSKPEIKKSLAAWQAMTAANFLADVSLPGEETGLKSIIERGLNKGGQVEGL